MENRLNELEKEVLQDFRDSLKEDDEISEFLFQIATVSAAITKSFLEKYEQEKKN